MPCNTMSEMNDAEDKLSNRTVSCYLLLEASTQIIQMSHVNDQDNFTDIKFIRSTSFVYNGYGIYRS